MHAAGPPWKKGPATNFAYSAKDRLEQVNLPDGRVASYKYDPFGRRVSKTVDGVVTYFLYADEGLIAEYDASGGLIKGYGWKPGGTWGTDPVFMTEGGQTYYYHNDHLGTPQKMTDASGAVVWSAQYTVFGAAHVDTASTIENNLRFPGQYFDAETGLHYNFHRYYDPQTGRYVTADPIGLMGGINVYSYAVINPLIYTDANGLRPQNQSYLECLGKCIEANRFDIQKILDYVLAGLGIANLFAVKPYATGTSGKSTNVLSKIALKYKIKIPFGLRILNTTNLLRMLGRATVLLTVFEGYYDITIEIQCAVECYPCE